MKWKATVVLLAVVGLLLIGCVSNGPPANYPTYSGAAGGQQQQYVGGGCGLAQAEGPAAAIGATSEAL